MIQEGVLRTFAPSPTSCGRIDHACVSAAKQGGEARTLEFCTSGKRFVVMEIRLLPPHCASKNAVPLIIAVHFFIYLFPRSLLRLTTGHSVTSIGLATQRMCSLFVELHGCSMSWRGEL